MKESSKRIHKRRAQAAMEYLMTHGWAVLAVLGAIAMLAYFGIGNPERFLPEKCIFTTGIACDDSTINGNNIQITLVNGEGIDMGNVSVLLDDNNGCLQNATGSNSIANDQRGTYDFDVSGCSLISGTKLNAELILTYINQYSLLSHEDKGELILKVP